MKIYGDHFLLNPENPGNVTTKNIALLPGVAQNLTEKWTYPDGLPDSITFSILQNDDILGQAAFKSIRWFNRKAELSLFLHPDHHGKRIGMKVMDAMIKHAFNHLNLHRLEAEVIEYNKPALNLVKKLGFICEGCLREARYFDGKYYSIYRFGLLRNEFEKTEKTRS